MSQLKDTSKLSTTSHKRQSGKSTGKVAVIDLTLIDSDADPSPDSDSDIEILPSKKRAKSSIPNSSKPSPTKHLKDVQPDSSATKNDRVAHHTEGEASARIAGSSEQDVSEVGGSKSATKAKKDAAELDKARKDKAFATELEEARKLRKEAAAAQKKLDKKEKVAARKTGNGGDGIVYLSVMDDKGQLLEGDDDGDNLRHLAMVKEIFPAGSVGSNSSYGFLSLASQMGFAMQIKTVTHFVNQTLLSRFEAAKQALKAAGRPTKEVMLFHGTGLDNIPKIMKGGFIIPDVEFGNGVWLARNPAVSFAYCQGGGMMFICRVLPGLFDSRGDLGLGPGLGHDFGHGDSFEAGKGECDSYSGSGGGDDIFVVRDARLVLPLYIVEFTAGMNQPVARPAPAVYQPPPNPTEQYRTVINAGGNNFNFFF